MKSEFAYYAFISYSHKDEVFARKLQYDLEHYRLPIHLYPQGTEHSVYLRPVFRDKTDLPIDSLSLALRDALAASRCLIVLCSEHSAAPNADGVNWVDRGIDFFASLRPGNTSRIIPIVVPGRGGMPACSVLPSGIRRYGLEPVNVDTEGEEGALISVISRLTGLEREALWEYHLRVRRMKHIRRDLLWSAAFVLVAGAAWWCREYFRAHVRYFSDYCERNNLPEGLFELTAEEARSRSRYYRFTMLRKKLRKVEYCNAKGCPVEHSELWNCHRPSIMELRYATRGYGGDFLVECIHRNAGGNVDTIAKFSPGHVDFMRRSKVSLKGGENSHESTFCPDRIVGRFRLTRAQGGVHDGLVVQELYFRYRSAVRVHDAWGFSGRAYELDEWGRPSAIYYLSVENPVAEPIKLERAETPQGVAGFHLHYREDGQMADAICVNGQGMPVNNAEGWAEARYCYDEAGVLLGINRFDSSGMLISCGRIS